jgi:hypothetical protein
MAEVAWRSKHEGSVAGVVGAEGWDRHNEAWDQCNEIVVHDVLVGEAGETAEGGWV